MTEQLKTMEIKGKQYVTVDERLRYFRENYKDYSLISEIIELTNERVVIKATILNPNNIIVASGHAFETQGSSFINKGSYVENCETSAWGRALGNLGIGIQASVATYDEMVNKVNNSNVEETTHICNDCKISVNTIHAQQTLKKFGTVLCEVCADNRQQSLIFENRFKDLGAAVYFKDFDRKNNKEYNKILYHQKVDLSIEHFFKEEIKRLAIENNDQFMEQGAEDLKLQELVDYYKSQQL